MGLTFGRNNNKKEEATDQKEEQASSSIVQKKSKVEIQYTKEEIQLILLMLRETTFKGENVELVYNLVLKLQKQYKDL